MEVLVAAAVLGLAAISFLNLLRDAGADAAHARRNTQMAALASTLLLDAKTAWRTGPHAGQREGLLWARRCAVSADVHGQRLALVACHVSVTRADGSSFVLDSAFAIPSETLRQL